VTRPYEQRISAEDRATVVEEARTNHELWQSEPPVERATPLSTAVVWTLLAAFGIAFWSAVMYWVLGYMTWGVK